jgi:hypothetical protein
MLEQPGFSFETRFEVNKLLAVKDWTLDKEKLLREVKTRSNHN